MKSQSGSYLKNEINRRKGSGLPGQEVTLVETSKGKYKAITWDSGSIIKALPSDKMVYAEVDSPIV